MTRSVSDSFGRIMDNFTEMNKKIDKNMALIATISKALGIPTTEGPSSTGTPHKESQKEDLFEDQDAEIGKLEIKTNFADDNNLDVPDLRTSENCLAGLSYVNYQKPGEMPQARGLEVVDKFWDLNSWEDNEGLGKKFHNVEKPKVVSTAKGSQDLAKNSTGQNTIGEGGVYDWNDVREVDDGGDFFLKNKELFFKNKGPKKRFKYGRYSKDIKEKKCNQTKLGDLVYTEMGVLREAGTKQKPLPSGEEVLQNNFIKNLNEHLHEVSGFELLDNGADKDTLDMRNIGPDTQMAVDVVEYWFFDVHLADHNKGVYNTGKTARQNKWRNGSVHSEDQLPYPSSAGVITRQAKVTKRLSSSNISVPSLSPKQYRVTKKRHNRVLIEAEHRRLAYVPTYHGAESTSRRSEKCDIEDQLDFSVPVDPQISKSTKLNGPKVDANFVDNRDVINDLVSAPTCSKRKAAREKNAINVTMKKIRNLGFPETQLDKMSSKDILGEFAAVLVGDESSTIVLHFPRPPSTNLPYQIEKCLAKSSFTHYQKSSLERDNVGTAFTTMIYRPQLEKFDVWFWTSTLRTRLF